jgi:hypothetical protein
MTDMSDRMHSVRGDRTPCAGTPGGETRMREPGCVEGVEAHGLGLDVPAICDGLVLPHGLWFNIDASQICGQVIEKAGKGRPLRITVSARPMRIS